ncbi:NAD(P)-dependent oxidoreductase [Faecalimonas sp.]
MNLLITGAWNDAKKYVDKLQQKGHNVKFLQFEKDELPCEYEWVEGVICNGLFLTHSIEKFVNLKYIQLTSAGFDRVPMDYVKEHKIEIHNARGVYSIPMAEFALFGVLEIYKKGKFFLENQKLHIWEKHRELLELFGKKVCILGCGSVGTECAKRFKAFGCEVTGIDLFVRTDENYNTILELSKLEVVLLESDIVILTLPLTDETKYLMNDEKFMAMKEGAVLVNIARGGVIDINALVRALSRLRGVVLDVFEEEPLGENSLLWKMQNVIVTPHNSFVGDGNRERLASIIIENCNKGGYVC